MRDTVRAALLTRLRRTRVVAVTTFMGGVMMAGCGGGAGGRSTPAARASSSSAISAPSRPAATATGAGGSALAFARCMRANGAPDFPDPIPGSGFAFHPGAGSNPAAPAVQAAQARCQRFMLHLPTGPTVGSTSLPANTRALSQLRSVAQCMRRHGIADFPDPQTSPPANANPAEYSNITNYEGVWILFPATINMQSPAWEQAAAACGPLAESFNRSHH